MAHTDKEIDYFCDIRPPAMTCEEVEQELCGVDRHNKTLCESCLSRHRNQTTAAKCTASQLSEFCSAAPPVRIESSCFFVVDTDESPMQTLHLVSCLIPITALPILVLIHRIMLVVCSTLTYMYSSTFSFPTGSNCDSHCRTLNLWLVPTGSTRAAMPRRAGALLWQ